MDRRPPIARTFLPRSYSAVARRWRALLFLAHVLALATGPAAAPMPHVTKCRLCHLCHLGETPPPGSDPDASASGAPAAGSVSRSHARVLAQASEEGSNAGAIGNRDVGRSNTAKAGPRKRRQPAYDPELDPTVPVQFKPSSYQPHLPKHTGGLPVCKECYGCRHQLRLISDSTVFMNTSYDNEAGATSSWIFRTRTNETASGEAVVKIYCLPVPKRAGAQVPTCKPERIAEVMRHLMAIDKLSVECGFTDLIPRMWLAPVRGVVPGVGYPIDWYGLWMEYVDGVSLENFLNKGKPRRVPMPTVAALLNKRLNASRVIRGAIFDLLTSQCDRHAQNIFIQEDGNIRLIDNESCLQHMWKNCGFDSVLVPTTQKQEIVRLANHYILKLPSVAGVALPQGYADPQLLLDYRCYLPPGSGDKMGTAYPPEVTSCLRRIADMAPKQVKAHFGFTELRVAENLHTRATDMITRGYEWAAKYGSPQNAPPKRYRFQPKCCKVAVNRSRFVCAHPWEPRWELPLGNPITGREWDKDRPDIGTYEGGTFPEDGPAAGGSSAATAAEGREASVGGASGGS